MCRPTNNNALTLATFDNKSFRRIRQRNDATAAVIDGSQMPEITQSSINSHSATAFFYANLNDTVDSEQVEGKRDYVKSKFEGAKGSRRSNTLRPDASGRINNKECHLFAFGALLEEELK